MHQCGNECYREALHRGWVYSDFGVEASALLSQFDPKSRLFCFDSYPALHRVSIIERTCRRYEAQAVAPLANLKLG